MLSFLMASSTTDTLPMAMVLHMLTLNLSFSNYFLWKNHMVPMLVYQNLMVHVHGSSFPPSPTMTNEGKESRNPSYTSWLFTDKKTMIILNSSLSKQVVYLSLIHI